MGVFQFSQTLARCQSLLSHLQIRKMKSTDFYLKYEILQIDKIFVYYINVIMFYTISDDEFVVDVIVLWLSAKHIVSG